MSGDLGLLVKKSVPLQCIDNDKIQVTLPLLPDIFDLPESVRMDPQLAEEAFAGLPESYEQDMANYIAFLDKVSFHIPGLEMFARFDPAWTMTASASDSGLFLDMFFRMNDFHMQLGYRSMPVSIMHLKQGGKLPTPEECVMDSLSLEVTVFYRSRQDSDIIFFSEEQFQRFTPAETLVDRDTWEEREVGMHAFASTYVDLVPHGLLVRNFGISYLNQLAKRAMNPQLPK